MIEKTNNPSVFMEEHASTIDLMDSDQKILPEGTKVIILSSKIFDHMLHTIIDNFYDVDNLWIKKNYPNLRHYVLNIY